jgi:hypothetical protein
MHCLLLLPNYKPLRKLTPIAPDDKCPKKPAFASIEPSRTIVVIESGSRKPLLLLDNCARKLVPSVEPSFIVMGVQKIRHPQTCNKFVVPTTRPIDLWQFDEQELLLPLLSIRSPSFCEELGDKFKIEHLFCKCVGLRLSSILMIGQKMSIKKDILVWL